MPSFGGVAIFGRASKIATGDLEYKVQENEFPAVSGVESLKMGSRGLFTTAEGLLYGATAAGLATAEATFRSYRDGNAYALVDSFGATWNNVRLDVFTPQGRIIQDTLGIYYRTYTARFRHLSAS